MIELRDLPAVNALLNLTAACLLVCGYVLIRRRRVQAHKCVMLAAFSVSDQRTTHDVDEALYLSDRVLLMSNGPNARIAEQVETHLPRPRDRATLAKQQEYFELRTGVVDFLVNRSHSTPPPASEPAEASTDLSAPQLAEEPALVPMQPIVGSDNA